MNVAHPSADPLESVEATWARRVRKQQVNAVEMTLVRHRRAALRDRVALAATRHRFDYGTLMGRLPRLTVSDVDPAWLAALARVVGTHGSDLTDRQDAIELYHLAHRLGSLPRRHGTALVELLLMDGRYDEAQRTAAEMGNRLPALLRLDLVNPFVEGSAAASRGPWEEGFASIWSTDGLEVPEIGAGDGDPFDRLECIPMRTTASGPLVTVIITTYEPDERLLTSVTSVVNQSWKNLDILIVDDASGPHAEEVLERARAMDPRIRLIKMPSNRGTYAARNVGIDAAMGTIITGQDDDDWSHPRRIERQILPLLSDAQLPATFARMIRATPQLRFHGVGFQPTRVSPISLMYRRQVALQLRGFAGARRSADSEFMERIEAALGRAPMPMSEPLLLARVHERSLSSGDFVAGWHHPARVAMRSSWRAWHADIRAGADPGNQPETVHVPARYRIDATPRHEQQLDVLLAGDWRHEGAMVRLLQDIESFGRSAGIRIGLMQLDNPWLTDPNARDLCVTVGRMVNRGVPLSIFGDRDVHATRLVVMDPLVLDGLPSEGHRVSDSAIVLASRAPVTAAGEPLYDPSHLAAHLTAAFAVEPQWVPTLRSTRSALSGVAWAPWELPPVIGDVRGRPPHVEAAFSVGPVTFGPMPPWDLAVTPLIEPGTIEAETATGAVPRTLWVPGTLEPTLETVRQCLEAVQAGLSVLVPESYREEVGDLAHVVPLDLLRSLTSGGHVPSHALSPRVQTDSLADRALGTTDWSTLLALGTADPANSAPEEPS